jgi:hypothetical protein
LFDRYEIKRNEHKKYEITVDESWENETRFFSA